MSVVAMFLGYVLIALVAGAALVAAGFLAFAYWPVAWTQITAGGRTKKGLFVPRADWRSNTGHFNTMNALIGLSSRKKSRWFFGLILFGKTDFDPDLAMPKLVPHKPFTAAEKGGA